MISMLSRPLRLLLPAALALAGGRDTAVALILAQLCSLCAGAALRMAGGRVVNAARMRGNYLLALAMGAAGGATAVLISTAFLGIALWPAAAGALAAMALICADRLNAASDTVSAMLCECVTALLTGAGTALAKGLPAAGAAGAAAALAIAVIVSFMSGRMRPVRPGFAVLSCVPAALLRSGVPAACFAAMMYLAPGRGTWYMLFYGLAAAVETPFRRVVDEGARPRALLAVLSAAAVIPAAFLSGRYPAASVNLALAAAMAVICVCLVFSEFALRPALIALLSAAAAALVWLSAKNYLPAGPAAAGIGTCVSSAAALALSLPDMAAVVRGARARLIAFRRK